MLHGRRRYLIASILMAGLIVATWSARMFIWPGQDSPQSGDAIVVYAGGHDDDRVSRAVDLMEAGLAPTLVISEGDGIWSQGREVQRLCDVGSDSFEIICIRPDPDNTSGESAAFAHLAVERDWQHLILVTTNFHLTRATLWLERCFSGRVSRVGTPSLGLRGTGHEWLGTIHALLIDRECPM